MKEIQRFTIPTKFNRLGCICWTGDLVTDFTWGVRYNLDGTCIDGPSGGSARFDRVICSPDGVYTIAYEEAWTKGIVRKNGLGIREINRSYYHADIYEYPVAIFKWFDGRTVIAHCPDKYNRLEIEEIETGERIISRDSESIDFFQSQLQLSPDGRYLLSAGWVWQPFSAALIYDLKAALENPEILDKGWTGWANEGLSEIYAGTFLDSNRVALAGDDDVGEDTINVICVRDISTNETLSKVQVEEIPGMMMAAGNYVVGFYKNPKLIDLTTGKVVHRWDDILSGTRCSCFVHDDEPKIHLALDAKNKRFAVGTSESITVVQLG